MFRNAFVATAMLFAHLVLFAQDAPVSGGQPRDRHPDIALSHPMPNIQEGEDREAKDVEALLHSSMFSTVSDKWTTAIVPAHYLSPGTIGEKNGGLIVWTSPSSYVVYRKWEVDDRYRTISDSIDHKSKSIFDIFDQKMVGIEIHEKLGINNIDCDPISVVTFNDTKNEPWWLTGRVMLRKDTFEITVYDGEKVLGQFSYSLVRLHSIQKEWGLGTFPLEQDGQQINWAVAKTGPHYQIAF